MTGYGEAHYHQCGLAVSVEVRCINNRYFKLSIRSPEGYASLEPQVESVVRRQIRRGTIQVNFRVDRSRTADDYRINAAVLIGYRRQLAEIQLAIGSTDAIHLENLLLLPGVVNEEPAGAGEPAQEWPLVERALEEAIRSLNAMRIEEGRAMAADLRANCRMVAASLDEIQRRAPLVTEAYRARLTERVNKLLAEYNFTLDPSDVLKEVGMFADRSDISEEVVRLRSHLEQFEQIMDAPESSGRKLEFLTQEMVRESNTIGSKANDVEIARHVIEIKAAIERIREMIQNVE
jgi:uncharacterized protein (TIGR00255 family)